MDEIILCPECGKESSKVATVCKYCGYPLNMVKKYNKGKTTYLKKKIVGIVLIAIGILLIFLSYKTRFLGDYDYNESVIEKYELNIKNYENSKQENIDAANSSSGYFKSSYKSIANSWQKLIDDANDSIDEFRGKQNSILMKSIVLFILSLLCIGVGGYLIKNNLRRLI